MLFVVSYYRCVKVDKMTNQNKHKMVTTVVKSAELTENV